MATESDTVTATYAARNFRELLDRVLKGETVRIERHGVLLAVVSPADQPPGTNSARLNQLLAKLPSAPASEAEEAELADIHRWFNQPVRDAWETQ